ncbi:hypothetical protein [Amphibacillus xylanus]|uniref:Uncharacterized protein n=1 Tax=Amphibacillus xylanus (strain ATCC 51415 / DSM 6626 / JCM 7361 / LMG 17667 / NBRC 15112 / Ep01) TaxID=698758 RepID=K0IVE2_AMPXN|nr:hypothetical protein [Amphibacillus xylanus]BAM46380.1 hypothetical protein AXY_02480 [Amphibacillus xylanus NBRC 15112]
MNKRLYRLIPYILLIGMTLILNYIFLPPLTFQSPQFRIFFGLFFLAVIFIELIFDIDISGKKKVSRVKYGIFSLPIIFVLIAFVIQFFNGPVFRATDYAGLIDVKEKDFGTDFFAMNPDQIPMMDRDTAERLGDRRIGSMSDLVSQFVPDNAYTQININNHPYRVTPLEYSGFMQWFNNRKQGIPNYLKVDMVSGEVTLEDLAENMKYSHSERFSRNVKRHLRRQYPTTIFRSPSFEVDDEGHPYYVATTYKNKFLFAQQEPSGVILLDAVTGETQSYDLGEIPTWMDRIYSAELILEQLNYYGKYTNGFWNSVFQKRGVTQTTEGYNYIPMNDDVYLYTGVTSVNSDASNIGFYLVNLRTKEAEFYPVTSADEFSAMASAEGSLQQMRYTSTFPLLISLNDRPYYISSLKDDSGLVRAYALVDAQDYQKVITSDTVDGLIAKLNGTVSKPEDLTEIEEVETDEALTWISGQVENISQAVVAGDTVYYFMIDGSIYKASIQLSDQLPFVELETLIEGEVNQNNVFRSIQISQ